MGPITDNSFPISNSGAFLELPGRIFPTPRVKSFFKLNPTSHLQNTPEYIPIIHTKTNIISLWKIDLLLLSFLNSEAEKPSLGSLQTLFNSNARSVNSVKSYAQEHLYAGNRGNRLNALTRRHFAQVRADSPVPGFPPSPTTSPHVSGLACRPLLLFKPTSPKPRPRRHAEKNCGNVSERFDDRALASQRPVTTLKKFPSRIAGRSRDG